MYIVTAGAVVARIGEGVGSTEGYFYNGAALPEAVPFAECERLAEIGLVEYFDDPEPVEVVAVGVVTVPDGDPSEEWSVDQLTAYAGQRGIDIGKATTPAGILGKIKG